MPDPDQHDRRERSDPPSWRPVPDPTELTTAALYREVAALRELIEERIEATVTLTAEKFDSVDRQLDLVERQRVEQKSDTEKAVTAALVAQKDAVKEQTIASEKAIQKSETSTKEQLNQITVTFTTALNGLTSSHDDLKDRVGKMEAIKIGVQENRTDVREGMSLTMGVITIIISLILVAVAIVSVILAVRP